MGCGFPTGATRFGSLPELLMRIGGEIPGGCGLCTMGDGCGLPDALKGSRYVDSVPQTQSLGHH